MKVSIECALLSLLLLLVVQVEEESIPWMEASFILFVLKREGSHFLDSQQENEWEQKKKKK